jgi:uncharacterized protein (TIGR02246 family)
LEKKMNTETATEFATRYTAAWCSQDPASVAAFFAEDGSLAVNEDAPAKGREAITAVAMGFMTTFPDMVLRMDGIEAQGDEFIYRWTLIGTNSGPDGNAVQISGQEEWLFDAGLVAKSQGKFDAADYQRQMDGCH